jgi:protein-tyrosine-phosphatase
VAAMARRGLDVSGHRSRKVDRAVLHDIDLVLTAERDHVVNVASIDPAAFRTAMTLPEFVGATARATASEGDLAGWVASLTSTRTAMAYLRDPIEEIDDPTGTAGRTFERAVIAIEASCATAASALVRAAERGWA